MFRRRRLRLIPQRLRWRLVLGFALTVALLQVGLTVVEQVLMRDALVHSVQQNLEDTIRTGLAGSAFSQPLAKQAMTLGSAGVGEKSGTPGVFPGKAGSASSLPLSPMAQQVFLAADV
ncbi:MAG TPA: hypothetical protein VN837_19855, partial [Chloroflexota bacterium]|nr:hypothetical protein [Chloroflexota bacterium]